MAPAVLTAADQAGATDEEIRANKQGSMGAKGGGAPAGAGLLHVARAPAAVVVAGGAGQVVVKVPGDLVKQGRGRGCGHVVHGVCSCAAGPGPNLCATLLNAAAGPALAPPPYSSIRSSCTNAKSARCCSTHSHRYCSRAGGGSNSKSGQGRQLPPPRRTVWAHPAAPLQIVSTPTAAIKTCSPG